MIGMNRRNRYITTHSTALAQRIVNDKYEFKRLCAMHGVPVPSTYAALRSLRDLHRLDEAPDRFVIKPARGHGGAGIMLLERTSTGYRLPHGRPISEHELKHHIARIIDGEFASYSEEDVAIVEERLEPNDALRFGGSLGMPDIRVMCAPEPVLAMLRYPTERSEGKANLSMGALGLGIELETGRITSVYDEKTHRWSDPSSIEVPPGSSIPSWDRVLLLAQAVTKLTGLGLCGVDLVIDAAGRVLVLEANAHPGLEIQNVNKTTLIL